MLKKINLSFYKSLINSDFSLLTSTKTSNSPYISASTTLLNSKQEFSTLDIEQLLKSCKQFIRILQFVKKTKPSKLILKIFNKQHFFLVVEFTKKYPISFPLEIVFFSTKTAFKSSDLTFHLLLESSDSKALNLKQGLNSNLFLFQKINSKIEIQQAGTYKVYNDLFDFKKVIFILILLDLILNKTVN